MILYSLACRAQGCGHAFDSWFSSSADYDRLDARNLVACPECGSSSVSKALMSPAVARGQAPPSTAPAAEDDGKSTLRAIRRHLEASAHNVGSNFAEQARGMHEGEIPGRSIYGDATPDEVEKLRSDGVPVSRIPWVPLEDA